jgi:hypothetical protein
MNRISLFFLILLLTACSALQPITPSPTPLPTFTPAPTATASLTPTPKPTPTSSFPPSLSPEDQDFLRAHADDPNVHWEFDAASGNTHVFINSDFDITNPALVEQIKAQCRNGDCTVISTTKETIWLTGKFSGDMEIVIDQSGGVDVRAGMVTVNDSRELVPFKFRIVFGTRDKLNESMWEEFYIEGDQLTIQALRQMFGAGKLSSLAFLSSDFLKDHPAFKKYYGDYTKEYYDRVRFWFEDGLSPRHVPGVLICIGLVEY